MIYPVSKPSSRLGRGAETYEAKCERRQETRESLRCRPNVTACRQMRRTRRLHSEQTQSPRQQQFFKRRNLEVEEGKVKSSFSKTQEFLRKEDQEDDLKVSNLCSVGESSFEQQESETSTKVLSVQYHPPPENYRDPSDNSSTSKLLPEKVLIKKPLTLHQGTQTKSLGIQLTIKNDASQQTDCGIAVLDKEIIQLSDYLKEALQRELVLKHKMVLLQELLSTLLQASDRSWKGQLNEDKLKCKLRSLENQLHTCTQKYSKEGAKKVLLEMEDQKQTYEQKAKETLQKLLEEKTAVEQQLESTQRSLAMAELKCDQWKEQYETLKKDWRDLGAKHSELESQLYVLQSKLQGADSRDFQLNQALHLLEREHQDLQTQIDRLQGDKELGCSNISDLQGQLQRSEEEKLALKATIEHLHSLLQSQSTQLHIQEELMLKKGQICPTWNSTPTHLEEKSKGSGEEREKNLRDQLQEKTLQLQAKEEECRELHLELDSLSDEYLSCQRKLQQCREELNRGQQPTHRRQCGCWLPVLTAMIAIALAAFLMNTNTPVV
ncbi:TRAF3-interacting JNK-activating modulator isoform X1 [Sarcophilus harrisii]|uniref:TRAF3 interacting protein 3 n=1 Tax=Sarcophilus harrisii TaxID=9305 RepID=G3WBT0_SARHA|nr:TRAF3-interacting JNK-activating modulator isoform X1 [Sarcophilus harrisii]